MIGSTKTFSQFFAEMGWGKKGPKRENGLEARRRNNRIRKIEKEIDNEWARRFSTREEGPIEESSTSPSTGSGHGRSIRPALTKQRGVYDRR